MKSDLNKPEVISLIRDWGLEGYGFYKVIKDKLKPKRFNISVRIELLSEIAKQYGISEFKAYHIIMRPDLFNVSYSISDDRMVSLKRSEES